VDLLVVDGSSLTGTPRAAAAARFAAAAADVLVR
jgi:hypothetical protein